MKNLITKYYKHIILIVFLFLLDILTKIFFKGKNIEIFKYFSFNYVENTGITFGLLKNNNLIFILITFVIVYLIIYYYKKEKKLQYGFDFVLAGAFGNLINRIFYGYVIDFIDFKIWPVFNLADMFVIIGALIILYKSWKS